MQRLVNKKKGALSMDDPEFRLNMAKDVLDVGMLAYRLLNGIEKEVDCAQLQPFNRPFEGKKWASVSDDCKELIQLMVAEDNLMRFTTNEVVSHPWLADK